MDKRNTRDLEKVIGRVEDLRTTIEERQSETVDDDGALREVVTELERVEDDLDRIRQEDSHR